VSVEVDRPREAQPSIRIPATIATSVPPVFLDVFAKAPPAWDKLTSPREPLRRNDIC